MYTDDDGAMKRMPPKRTQWYNMYVQHPHRDCPSFQKDFRLRFRLPYAQFEELAKELQEAEAFNRWNRDGGAKDRANNEPSPIPLLLLACLRYLGRGWTFDDLAEATAVSRDVIRVFFHAFIEYGSTTLYDRHVRMPVTLEEGLENEREFKLAGFPGAVGSMDATHILLEKVSNRTRQAHLGFKMSHTARSYNVTVNHRRRILSTTHGHPARWNDKTLVMYDEFATALKDGSVLDDLEFELYEYDEEGNVVKRKYRGAWLLVDDGYLDWSVTVPPIKTTTS